MVLALCEKEQDVAGDKDHAEGGQHNSRTNTLVVVPGDKHNTVSHSTGMRARCRHGL